MSILDEEPLLTEHSIGYQVFSIDTSSIIPKLVLLNSLRLGDRLRYSPWSSIAQLYSRPLWFNCTSLTSWLLADAYVDLPAELRKLTEDY